MRLPVCAAILSSLLISALPAYGNSFYQASLIPDVEGSHPGFSAHGSTLHMGARLGLRVTLINVVDANGDRITTDGVPSADDYSVEVDISIPATGMSGTVSVSFDLTRGNARVFKPLTNDPLFAGAVKGDGVAVNAVRVKDGSGTVIGHGGFSIQQ